MNREQAAGRIRSEKPFQASAALFDMIGKKHRIYIMLVTDSWLTLYRHSRKGGAGDVFFIYLGC